MQREQSRSGTATTETQRADQSASEQGLSSRGGPVSTLDVDVGHRVPARLVRSAGRVARGRAVERPYCPKISIIMATYRRQHTILRTVNRIVAQSYPHWELIVIDNARSGDYRFDDPRIQVYRHAARASASYARNEGIRYATGDLLLFFDDDDDMFPTYLESFVGAFREHPEAKMARCGMYRRDGARASPSRRRSAACAASSSHQPGATWGARIRPISPASSMPTAGRRTTATSW